TICDVIKKVNPKGTIIAGNSVATSIPEILLTKTKADIGVMGESDITIVELLKSLIDGLPILEIEGIVFKEDGRVCFTPKRKVVENIDSVGFPDWNIFNISKYQEYSQSNAISADSNENPDEDVVYYPLNSARGCPFNCTFCYHVFKGEKYRRYSEDEVIGEIVRLKNVYKCNHIGFWDELTFSSIKGVRERIKKLNELDFKVSWTAPIRGDLFKKEHVSLIRELKSTGCNALGYSLENASPDILKAINKRMSVEQFVEQSKALWDGGITPLTSVIFGYPQETPESIRLTIKVCEECNMFPSVGYLLPLPGTPIYEWAKDNGHIKDEEQYLQRVGDRQDFHVNLTKMPTQEMISIVTEELGKLAKKQGLKLDSVLKTGGYKKVDQKKNARIK
ncbi:MAG: radical SAM protein, partial [Candidatus Zapsychrus exili]|nr:radical SAM protein [Candidatus Zapsychrus exili]